MKSTIHTKLMTANDWFQPVSSAQWRRENPEALKWVQDLANIQPDVRLSECEQEAEISVSPPKRAKKESELKTIPLKRAQKLENRIKRLEQELSSLRKEKSTLEETHHALSTEKRKLVEELKKEHQQRKSLELEMQFLARKLKGTEQQRVAFKDKADRSLTVIKELGEENLALQKLVKELKQKLFDLEINSQVRQDVSVETHFEDLSPVMENDNLEPNLESTEQDVVTANTHVVMEELGVLYDSGDELRFRGINNPELELAAPVNRTFGLVSGDVVRMVQWSDGTCDLVRLEVMGRSLKRGKLTQKKRTGVSGRIPVLNQALRPEGNSLLVGNVVIVGGDCPTRYTESLRTLAKNVEWHDGFDKKGELDRLVGHADIVITIETQMSHWAMHRVKHLAKQGMFMWRHVKVKSQAAIVNAVFEAAYNSGIVGTPKLV